MRIVLFPLLVAAIFISSCSSLPDRASRQVASETSLPQPQPILEEDSDRNVSLVGVRPKVSKRDRYVGIYDNPTYTPLLDLVNNARKTIDIEIYMMNDKAFRSAIRKAMRRGVIVRVVKEPEPLGETCKYFREPLPSVPIPLPVPEENCLDQMQLVKEIQARGAFVPFKKEVLCGQFPGNAPSSRCFQHGKIVIIDRGLPARRLALISSGNFNNSNLCVLEDNPSTCNRDYSYVTRDKDVIDGLVRVFENDLKQVRYENTDSAFTRKVTVSPFSKEPLIEFIRTAKKRIQVENQYMKDRDLNQALMEAALRGVSVEIMVASDCAFGKPKEEAKTALEKLYRELETAGVRLRFFTSSMKQRGKNGYLHAKAIVVDENSAWIGSVNGSTTSLDLNREYGIFYTQPDRVHFLSKLMEQDFQDVNSESWQESFNCKKDQGAPAEK